MYHKNPGNGVKKFEQEMSNVEPIPFDQIPKTDGLTLIDFSLPFELVEKEGEYFVSVGGYKAKISVKNELLTDYFKGISDGHLVVRGIAPRVVNDTRGFSVISKVKMEIQFLTNPGYFPQIVLEYLNRMLDVWRFVTGKFWLKEAVSDKDILTMKWEIRPLLGEKQEGFFGFGLPGALRLPVDMRDLPDALPTIIKYLEDERTIPLFHILKLNAWNHFIERRFDLAIIEINIALEEYVTRYLISKLLGKGNTREDAQKRIGKYEGLSKKMDKGFKDICGFSLKDDQELRAKFIKMRSLRKNSIHPFVRKASYQDAMDVMKTISDIIEWMNLYF
jgi:hypothetical protein